MLVTTGAQRIYVKVDFSVDMNQLLHLYSIFILGVFFVVAVRRVPNRACVAALIAPTAHNGIIHEGGDSS